MTFTALEAHGPDGSVIAVSTVDGSALLSHVSVDRLLPVATGLFGVDATGPYFNTAGALPGEQASVGYDAAAGGLMFVEAATDPTVHGLMLTKGGPADRVVAREHAAQRAWRLREKAREAYR